MNLRIIALLAATLPFFAVHLTWLLAASYGLVEWCNPYIDSCTSISATGRHAPASYVFRATMLPAAVVLALGILTVVLQAWGSVLYDAVEDAFE